MFLLKSYPTWVNVVFIIWIVSTIIGILILLSFRKKTMPIGSRSFLYEKTKQIVNDFHTKLDKEQLTPWVFFNTGKMPEVKKYYGGTIKVSGIRFSDTIVLVFWDGYIEPFLEHGIVDILEQTSDEALIKQLDPELCISEVAGLLDSVIVKTYNRMAEIDQKLRGKGNPKSVKRKDVSEKIEKMLSYLQRHKEAISKIAASKHQYFLNVESRQNKNLSISIIALSVSIISTLIALIAIFKK